MPQLGPELWCNRPLILYSKGTIIALYFLTGAALGTSLKNHIMKNRSPRVILTIRRMQMKNQSRRFGRTAKGGPTRIGPSRIKPTKTGPTKACFLILIIIAMAVPAATLYAGGRQEKSREESGAGERKIDLEQETTREVELYILTKSLKPSPAAGTPASQAVFFIFQSAEKRENGLRISSNRELSMPIRSKKRIRIKKSGIEGGLYATEYRAELTPSSAIGYSPISEVEVSFGLADLIGTGRIKYQPARYAALEALEQSKEEGELIRIEEMSFDGKSTFTARVLIADPGPRTK